MKSLLYLPYFGNIEFYSVLKNAENVLFEIHDTYPKQTYRNRTQILGSNGVIDLSIPVKKPNGSKSRTFEVLIDYSNNWQNIHCKSIKSAYKNSPYFDYYGEEIFALINKEHRLLIDKNKEILHLISTLIGSSIKIKTTTEYEKEEGSLDFRSRISPKVKSAFKHTKYIQVFEDRFEFQPNLSILDLLFNEGPNAGSFLNIIQ